MVKFYFYDKSGTMIPNIDASGDLPDEVASMRVQGPYDCNTSKYKVLTTMLKESPKMLEKIFVKDLSAESPQFLSFLVLICNKTKKYLNVANCHLSSNATTCLMAALLPRDGIRSLSISWMTGATITTDQAKILFEGVASSPCLESFEFTATSIADRQSVGRYLIEGLRQNQSLKSISLLTAPFTRSDSSFLPNVLEASILGPNVRSVSIQEMNEGQALRFGVLQDILCRRDCNLEKLHLEYVDILVEDYWNGSTLQNTSVTSLSLPGVSTSGRGKVTQIVGLFKSLAELNLSATDLTELSFLDPLLFGKSSQLKSLDVSYNDIDEEEMKNFIEKLRKVSGLKHLAIGDDEGGISESVNTALIDALRNNKHLELVDYFDGKDLPFDLNRGGRRVFEPSLESFPLNLLPRVLKRASKISYYGADDTWGSPSNEEGRSDVVFWMIRRAVPHL